MKVVGSSILERQICLGEYGATRTANVSITRHPECLEELAELNVVFVAISCCRDWQNSASLRDTVLAQRGTVLYSALYIFPPCVSLCPAACRCGTGSRGRSCRVSLLTKLMFSACVRRGIKQKFSFRDVMAR